MPGRHFLRRDYLHIFFSIKFLVFVSLVPQISYLIPILTNCRFEYLEKKNTISRMRLRSVFKMRMSILNTATTEQMGYGIFSFFVYTKSTN